MRSTYINKLEQGAMFPRIILRISGSINSGQIGGCSASSRGDGADIPSAEGENTRTPSRPPAREEENERVPRAVSRFDPLSIALLSHYIETWIPRALPGPSSPFRSPSLPPFPPYDPAIPARTRGTRVKISPVMHGKFGHGRLPLPRLEHADPTRNIINSRLPDDRVR